MTSLFPDLDSATPAPVKRKRGTPSATPRSYPEDKALLKEKMQGWARSLEGRLPVTITEEQVTVGSVVVDFSAGGASSEELQKRKADALEGGQELYFVFPWEVEALPALLSHFNSRLKLDSRKFAARRLKAERISNDEANTFAAAHHIQKSASGSGKVSYGLRHKETGELLAVQQYCKTRWGIKKLGADSSIWEGLRLVIKSDVQIHGAATKLQSLFLAEEKPTELMSYVDWSHSIGGYKKTQGFEREFTSREAYMWVLATDSPTDIMVVDKNGEERHPDLAKVLATPYINPNRIAGPFGLGVGRTFYGGKLGSRKQLKEQGNELYHNDLILEGLGYRKVFTAGQLKWTKLFPENESLTS